MGLFGVHSLELPHPNIGSGLWRILEVRLRSFAGFRVCISALFRVSMTTALLVV